MSLRNVIEGTVYSISTAAMIIGIGMATLKVAEYKDRERELGLPPLISVIDPRMESAEKSMVNWSEFAVVSTALTMGCGVYAYQRRKKKEERSDYVFSDRTLH